MALDDFYRNQIKGFEGYTPRAAWDYKQHSNGFGTRALFSGETIDRDEAERRLSGELSKAESAVDAFHPSLDKGTRAALTSLTYNAGPGWMNAGLGQAVKAGDLDKARQLFAQYNKAGGETLPGLAARRAKEVSWFGGEPGTASPSPNVRIAQAMTAPSASGQQTMSDVEYFGDTPEELSWKRQLAAKLIASNNGTPTAGTGWAGGLEALARVMNSYSGHENARAAREGERNSQRAQSRGLEGILAALAPQASAPQQAPPLPPPMAAPTPPPPSQPQPPMAGPTQQLPNIGGGGPSLNLQPYAAGPAIGVGAMPSMPPSGTGMGPGMPQQQAQTWPDGTPMAQPGGAPPAKGPPAPLASNPLTVGQGTQDRDKLAEFASLNMLMKNSSIPLQYKLKAMEDYKTKWSPTDEQKLGRRLNELKITQAERELNDPSGKITILPEGARAIMSDPRTGAARVIGQGGVKQTSSDKKALYEAEDEIPALDSTINALGEAKRLNNLAYTGMTAGARGSLGTSVGGLLGVAPDAAVATAEYQKLMNQQAIESMSRVLKGATTDREMAQFVSIISDLSQPPEVRERAIDRLAQLAERTRAVKRARIQELRGGERQDVPPPTTQAPPPQIEDQKEVGGKAYVKINGQWFER